MESGEKIWLTPYEWCIKCMMRPLDLNEWPLKWYDSKERHFFEFPTMTETEFLETIAKCNVKYNSLPRKTEMYLEYRMYGLVPYQLGGTIHAGIQFGHAVVEYSEEHRTDIYKKWAKKDKTFIILNGGTTNDSIDIKRQGTLNKHRNTLFLNDIIISSFCEPDLGDQLTAVVFLVDERVWNRELYPDFKSAAYPWSEKGRSYKPLDREVETYEKSEARNKAAWQDKIGGPKNEFLRTFLKDFRLA